MSKHGKHKPKRCPISGKLRYRERQDAGMAITRATFARGMAAANGVTSENRVIRSYKCECGGYHTTSQPKRGSGRVVQAGVR